MLEEYPGHDYDLLRRNCTHFADDFCQRLGVGGIPGWIHRLARFIVVIENMVQLTSQSTQAGSTQDIEMVQLSSQPKKTEAVGSTGSCATTVRSARPKRRIYKQLT